MNLQHLRYVAEVERVGSITKAAANLFMGQPNLSKTIKEVEAEVGIQIFRRSAKGVVPTEKGAEFLEYARAILVQLDKIEELYKSEAANRISFSISVPRASYISHAFTRFITGLDRSKVFDIDFRETNSVDAVNNVADSTSNMAVIRYELAYEEYFLSLLSEKGMKSEKVLDFEYRLLISEKSPLAEYDDVPYDEVRKMTEILHGDLSVPYLSANYTKKNEKDGCEKRIYVYERGSQFDLLKGVPDTFMWVSPIPDAVLENTGLTERRCSGLTRKYRDMLICHSTYRMTDSDIEFTETLKKVTGELKGREF